MHILLFALGSAGDVHPVLGLATALRARGHQIVVATNPFFQELVERLGLPFVAIGTAEEFREVMEDPGLWDPIKGFDFVVNRLMVPYMQAQYEIVAAHRVPGDTVVVAPPTALGARIATQKMDVPLATMHLAPAPIRSVYDAPRLPPMLVGKWVPRWLKRLQYWMADHLLVDPKLAGPVNAMLAEHGLPPVEGIMNQWWHSPQLALCLFPDWFAPPQPDWPPQCVLTGFPLWDEREVTTIAPGVEAFLQAGDPPIVFTPGSAMLHGQEFFRAAIDACHRLNRGMFLTRYPEQLPDALPSHVAHFDFVPLSQLLPRAAAIVHHAGIGTCAQGLAAGIPQVTMPMAHDQHDNAERLRRLSVGEAIPPRRFQGNVLAATLARLINARQVRAQCRDYADRIDTSVALDRSCRAIEGLLDGHPTRQPQLAS